jgi:hypothetical protein
MTKRQPTLLSTADGLASIWMSLDGFHEKIGGETSVFGRRSNGGFWPKKIKNALSFNES